MANNAVKDLVMDYVGYCCSMAGAVGKTSEYVTANEWRAFVRNHSDLNMSHGHLFEVIGADSAAGMVKVTSKWK
jgi:hypothetical protein